MTKTNVSSTMLYHCPSCDSYDAMPADERGGVTVEVECPECAWMGGIVNPYGEPDCVCGGKKEDCGCLYSESEPMTSEELDAEAAYLDHVAKKEAEDSDEYMGRF